MEELRKSSYVIIDSSDNIIYDFDEVVRFVIRSYFSAMYVAASWIAGYAIQHKKPYLSKGSVVLHQKEIDRIAYRLLANSIDVSKGIEEELEGYISNLLCTTNEIRPRLKDYPDVLPNESDVSKWMETYGFNDTIRKTIDYYFDRFNKNLPIDPCDEVSRFAKPKSGYHIDSWYVSQALPLIFFDTLCSFLSDNDEIWLSVEMKSMVSDLIAIMFAGTIVSAEFNKGTIKNLLVRPYTRNKILLAKFITSIIMLLFGFVVIGLIQAIVGGFVFGFENYRSSVAIFDFATRSVQEMSFVKYILISILARLPKYLLLTTLAFALSTITLSSPLALTFTFVGYSAATAINTVAQSFEKAWFLKFFVTPNWDFTEFLFGKMPSFKEISLPFSAMICLIYFAIMIVASFAIFKKRDVKKV